jgi:hypothetical protein
MSSPLDVRQDPPERVSRRSAWLPESEPPLGPLALAVVVVSAAFIVAGVVWPAGADTLLRLLIATLVIGIAVFLAYRFIGTIPTSRQRNSPFDDGPERQTPSVAPEPLLLLGLDLKTADTKGERLAIIPASAERILRVEAARRLTDHRGLNIKDPQHRARIRSLVTDATWRVIRVPDPGLGVDPVPLGELSRILEEVENL